MKVTISKRPFSIMSNSRILYRIIQILFTMHYTGRGNQKTVSLLKLHLLTWTIQTENRKTLLLQSINSDFTKSIGIWEIDENINKALTYMYEDDLCIIKKQNYSLTTKGKEFIFNIVKDKEIFIEEKEFFQKIGKKINETNVTKLKNLWII
jgi:hypothetical protein